MKKLLQILRKRLPVAGLVASLFFLMPVTFCQSVFHTNGSLCVGATVGFAYAGQGTVTFWGYSGNVTVISQTSNTINLRWNSATTNIQVYANVSGGTLSPVYSQRFDISSTVTPSVSITSDKNNICGGTPVTFTATPVNGGSSPYYTWYVNGTSVSGFNSNTFTSSTLTNGQQVTCALSSSAPCVSANSVNSNAITMQVTAPLAMSISISGNTSICQGGSANLSASVLNTTGNLAYHWQKNGFDVSSTVGGLPPYALTYSPVNNNDVFTCRVTSDGCAAPATSNALTMSFLQPQPFSVGIGISNINPCPGAAVVFTATPTASADTYQWYMNGSGVGGATGPGFTTTASSVSQLQSIQVVATTHGYCLQNTSATGSLASAPFTIPVPSTPSVTIENTTGIYPICTGASVSFSATPVNGGGFPHFQWLLNGNPIAGANSISYVTTTLTSSDQISCQLTSNAPCASPVTVSSNIITTHIVPLVGPASVPTGNTSVCQNSTVFYSSTATNAGGYLWSILPAAAGRGYTDGSIVLNPSYTGPATVSVQAQGCNSTSAAVTLPITIVPSVGVPSMPAGTTRRYRGDGTDVYASSATTATGYEWTLTPEEAGSIDEYGTVTWNSTYFGPAFVQVQALGCGGPTQPVVRNVEVYTTLSGGSISPSAEEIPSGTSPALLAGDPATGGLCNGSYHYQWQSSSNGTDFSDIPNANDPSYQPGSLTAGVWYRRQVTCTGGTTAETAYTNTCQITLGTVDPENMNYIRIRSLMHGGVTDAGVVAGITSVQEVQQQTTYFDGLGRDIQTVNRLASGGLVDLVQPMSYDDYGQVLFQYLPYASPAGDGKYRQNARKEQTAFEQVQNPGESFYYAQTDYEPSPMERGVKNLTPGSGFGGSGHGVSTDYWTNTATDDVKIWAVTDAGLGNFGSYAVTGPYLAGSLFKTVTTDEQGHQTITFKDNEGLVILRKVQLTAAADDGSGSGYNGWICTYYIYDDYNKLRAVLQPKAVDYLSGAGWVLNGDILSELTFRFEYDQRHRLSMKLTPGAKSVYTVFDARDRAVMTQDGNMRAHGQWLYTQYDGENRPVATGIWNNTQDLTVHAPAAAASISYPSLSGQTYQLMTHTYYDNYDWVSSVGTGLREFDNSYASGFYAASNVYPYADAVVQSLRTTGKVTGTQVANLSVTGQLLNTVNFYDDKERLIQAKSDNITQGIDVTTAQYSWNNSVLHTLLHQVHGGVNIQTHDIWTRTSYDGLWRITRVEKSLRSTLVNGNVYSAWKTVSQQGYDAIGQVTRRTLGNKNGINDGSQPLVTLDQTYHIQGWLLSINRNFLSGGGSDRYFGMEVGYDKDGVQSFAHKQFNGSIAGVSWKAAGDGEARKYDYSYDVVNRLLKADFTDNKGYDFGAQLGDGVNPATAYDLNGNLLSMRQNGLKNGASSTIDQLEYHYYNGESSNRLLNVIDHNNDPNTQLGDFRTSILHPVQNKTATTTDYIYDDDGRLITDLNKDITDATNNGIDYNYLNLPSLIRVKNKGTIAFTYDALGRKLSKTVQETGQPVQTTLYMEGGIEYQNDVLQFIGQEDGRIRYEAASTSTCSPLPARFVYDYFIRDNQGNTRTVLTEQQESICYLPATVEDATVAQEKQFYDIQDGQITAMNQVNNGSNYPQFNQRLYKVNGGVPGQKTGLGIVLKVMSGDKVSFSVQSIYDLSGGYQGPPVALALADLLGAFAGSSALASHGLTPGAVDALQPGQIAGNFLPKHGELPNRAEAYLNYMLFDDQFRYVSGDVDPVQTGGGYKLHDKFINAPVTIAKNGYIYIFVSNESDLNVFFDNLVLTHTPGPLMEETEYYPFGLTMAGISDKAVKQNYAENKNRYDGGVELQNKEFSDGTGLELYATTFRSLDPQLGKFWQTDPMAIMNQSSSPYAYCLNDPIGFTDPLGLDTNRVNVKVPAGTKPETMITVTTPTGGTSMYIYRPGDPTADAQGLVSVGMVEAPEDPIIVTPSGVSLGGGGGGGGGGAGGGGGGAGHIGPNTQFPGSANVQNPRHIDNDLGHLDPRLRPHVQDFIRNANAHGFHIGVFEAYRSGARQNFLYAQGRTAPGGIVTAATAGHSYHNYGLAVDVVFLNSHGEADWSQTITPQIAGIAAQEGLRWGGGWDHPDYPHFEMTFGQSVNQLLIQHGLH